jgi:hypothetical protein
MNPDSRKDKRSKNNRTAKAIDAMHIAGIVVAASMLLSGLSVVGSYNSAFSQQNVTGGGGNATTTGGAAAVGNATGGVNQSEVRLHLEEVRTALQNNDIQGALVHLDLALNLLGSNMTTSAGGGAATNATMGGSGEGTTTTAGGSTAGEGEGSGGGALYGG